MDIPTVNKDKFDKAVQMLATVLPATSTFEIKPYEMRIKIDDSSDIVVFPSNEESLPLGVGAQAFDRTGGMSSEALFGLVADHQGAQMLITGILAEHRREDYDQLLVLVEDVRLGDVIVDLGMTVESREPILPVSEIVLTGGDMSICSARGVEVRVARPIHETGLN